MAITEVMSNCPASLRTLIAQRISKQGPPAFGALTLAGCMSFPIRTRSLTFGCSPGMFCAMSVVALALIELGPTHGGVAHAHEPSM